MIVESQFTPNPLLTNRHLQTLIGPFMVPVRFHPDRWQTIDLPDDDFLEIAWFGEGEGPIVLVAHGLEGSYRSHYIQRVIAKLLPNQWRVAVMHFRSCGRAMNRRMNSYHSGSSDELASALEVIAKQQSAQLYGLGFSLGGNVLLKWLGESSGQGVLKKAMAVSVPLKLDVCATSISRGMSRIYQKHLIDALKVKTRQKLTMDLPGPMLTHPIDLKRIKNFWQFDHLITAPLNGFAGVDDYYEKASSFQFLPHIDTPTLILQALDDPFMSPDIIPEVDQLGSQVVLELSQTGGHVGFLDHLKPLTRPCFLANRVYEYFSK